MTSEEYETESKLINEHIGIQKNIAELERALESNKKRLEENQTKIKKLMENITK